MSRTRLFIVTLIMLSAQYCAAQTDSVFQALENLQKVPVKYLDAVQNKIDKYRSRITGKTEKTLAKLSKWENKIKNILDQVSPETSAKLFGNNAMTFTTVLKKIQEGKAVADGYEAKYNEYRDKLTTSIKYLEDQKDKLNKNIVRPVNDARKKLDELEKDVSNTEAVEAFIKERKMQLLNEAVKYIGKSKYLTKIDKESYYYIETLRNYKELFSDKKKTEEIAIKLLNKVPGFTKFMQDNSMIARLFGSPNTPTSIASMQGLQTRTSVNSIIQGQLAAAGPSARESFSQCMQQVQAEISKLKDKIMQGGGDNSDANIPSFKPNNQRSKTILQRLEMGTNIQFVKNNSYVPAAINIGLTLGYKINDKSLLGIGVSYKMGYGSIQRLSITHQGLGIRTFIDWKLRKQFYISGGYEANYNSSFKNIYQLKEYSTWQSSSLIGLSKKVNVKTKLTKGVKLQILYDFLANQHTPISQPLIFRTGYNF